MICHSVAYNRDRKGSIPKAGGGLHVQRDSIGTWNLAASLEQTLPPQNTFSLRRTL